MFFVIFMSNFPRILNNFPLCLLKKDDILEKIQMTYDNNEGLLKKNLNE